MNATQLEGLVFDAVTRVQGKMAGEDDRIEFKREWPNTKKARQLAAAANRSRGEWLIYVIGLDEADGSIHPTAAIDPATWWAQMESSFDEVAPELVRHLNVWVSETESVIALMFRTDRTPYVVKGGTDGGAEREVPIRVGTRTRSAHRHELLRLLLPAVAVPVLGAVSTSLTAGRPDYVGGDSDSIAHMRLRCQIYFEHLGSRSVFLPLHLARATVRGGEFNASTRIYYSRPTNTPAVNFGVSLRGDGIELSGPGVVNIEATWVHPREQFVELGAVDEWQILLEFGVAGTDRQAALEIKAGHRTEEIDTSLAARGGFEVMYNWSDNSSGDS